MELYLIRHGEMAGDPHEHSTPPVNGCLSPTGTRQAEALAKSLRKVRFDAVYASPLGRAIQTAQPIADRRRLTVTVLPWLEEWRPAHVLREEDPGDFEGMMEAAARLPVEQTWKTDAGESVFQMADRIVPGILALLKQYGVRAEHGGYVLEPDREDARAALVAHGGSLGVLTGFLLGLPLHPGNRFLYAQTGVAVIRFVRQADVWYPALSIPAPHSL